MVSGWNVIDGNTNTADVHGHGTQVAGTAAATSENGIGVASVAGSAKIMPIRIADANGYASYSNIGKGLTWSADKGARVANISISGVAGSSTVRSAAQYMKDRGGLVVSGAGNSGGVENISATDTIISVSGTTSSDVKASWSSYGQYVDLAAPGAGIWTTKRGGSYGSVSGTSFAGPVVAGVLALMKEVNPKLNQTDLEKILLSTAVDLGTAGYDTMYGHGRVNAAAAVKTAAGSSTAADTSAPTVSVVSPAGGATVQGLVAVDVAASDNVGVSRVDLLVNGTRFASDTSAPYAFSWDSTKVADGGVTLTAQAFDAAGNYASRAVSVTVANASSSSESGSSGSSDTTAPIATISSPADGSTVSGYVVVSVSATDNVGVTATRLYIDGGLVKSGGSKFNYRWSTQKIAAGKHTVMVEAEDAAGNKGSRSVTVTR
jgi:subtilisin family serine protease